jgi:hypothetical protein
VRGENVRGENVRYGQDLAGENFLNDKVNRQRNMEEEEEGGSLNGLLLQ